MVDAGFNRGRVSTCAVTTVAEVFNRYLSRKVRNYLGGNFPLKRRACLQPYRRNLIFFEQTSKHLTSYVIFALAQSAVMVTHASIAQIPPAVVFWLENAVNFGFVEISHGIILPLGMTVPPVSKSKQAIGQFYVHKPQLLEPRRYVKKGIKSSLQPAPTIQETTSATKDSVTS